MPNIWPRTQIFSEIKIKMLGFFIVNLLDRISASQWRNSPLSVPPNYLNLISDLSDDLIRLGWGLAITDRAGMMMASVVPINIWPVMSVSSPGVLMFIDLCLKLRSVTGAGAKCDVTRRVGWCQLVSAPPVRPWVTHDNVGVLCPSPLTCSQKHIYKKD